MNNIELARETVRKFIGAHEATMDSYQQKGFDEGVALVAALLARVRLEEAKWWCKRVGSWTDETAARMVALEQAAGGEK